uniref:Putative secreted protein n=1 Tax=Ixodes ricinus TaxID=34613 RepID=A0A6B0UK06_IXORI
MPGARLRLVCLVSYLACTSKCGPLVAINDVTEAGVSFCRMSRSWQLGVEMLVKSSSERECCCRRGVPTSGCLSFRGLPHLRATCSRTGVCNIHQCCWDAARIATGGSVTLL